MFCVLLDPAPFGEFRYECFIATLVREIRNAEKCFNLKRGTVVNGK
uniref:Uncharacterized protein n=1 Tax=Nelumbo nucifera TaxID=4432 RepID=A0A822XIL9_NELNU|nr:TPA_asm: hypothetical protein HUJ06_020299 [Nelumbo nucifera]